MENKKKYRKIFLACYLIAAFARIPVAGPAIISNVSQRAGENLQAGVLAVTGFLVVLVNCVLLIRKKYKADRV